MAAPTPYDSTSVLSALETGDIVLFNRRCSEMGSALGISLCLFAKWTSLYDHVGVIVHPHDAAGPMVLEAGFRGVTLRPLAQRLDRQYHDTVAVRHLMLDHPDTSRKEEARKRIESFAEEVEGALYKRRLSDFLSTALQPPEKRLAIDVCSALNATEYHAHAMEKLQAMALTPGIAAGAARRGETLREEATVLQASSMEHRRRLATDMPPVVGGREPSRRAGFVCSELTAEAFQRAGIADAYPGPMNYSAHDWSSLAATTSADDVRHRRPPALCRTAALGPEVLLKKQPLESTNLQQLEPPNPEDLVRFIEAGGWSFESAAAISRSFRPLFMQRGEVLDLGAESRPDRPILIPASTRLVVALRASSHGGLREGSFCVLLPRGVALGLNSFPTASPPTIQPETDEPLVAIAESDGYVWVATSGKEVREAVLPRMREQQRGGLQLGGSGDTRLIQLRRGQSPEGCATGDLRAPYALYVVVRGVAHDATVDRVYRQGEVIGLDTFVAHLPASPANGGWVGPVQSCRLAEPPRPIALRDGTLLERVTYGDVLQQRGITNKTLSHNAFGNLDILLQRYQLFYAYCDGRLRNDASNPSVLERMDLAHRHLYFKVDRLPRLASGLLDTLLFQGREDNTLLFSDILRVEEAARVAALKLLEPNIQRADAQAALLFLGSQASHDGCTVSITNINDLIHALYRGRPDAPFISLVTDTSQSDDGRPSDANLMSQRMKFVDLLDLCANGALQVPATVTADTALLVKHIALVCCGDTPFEVFRCPEEGAGDTAASSGELTPEKFFDEEMVRIIRGEAWDISSRSAAVEYAGRVTSVVMAATLFNMALFPLHFVAWHRMIFGDCSRWSIAKAMKPRAFFDLMTHTVHGIFLRRAMVGLALYDAGIVGMRPDKSLFDPYLDELPRHPHWEAVRYGLKLCVATTVVTYPMEVALIRAVHRSAEPVQGAAAVNFHATQTSLRSALQMTYANFGIRGLFRGIHLAPVAATPFFGAHWLWYHEVLVPLFIDKRYAPSVVEGRRPSVDSWYAFGSSSTAALWKTGVVGWVYFFHTLIAHPVEVVRYLSIASQVPPRAALYSIIASCNRDPRKIVGRLYAGWATSMVRAIPMMFGSFALSGLLLTDYRITLPDVVQRRLRYITSI